MQMKSLPALTLAIILSVISSTSEAQTQIDFQQGLNGYSGALDTKIKSDAPTTNFGSTSDIEIDGSPDYGALLYWDLSAIPSGSIVTAVEITVNAFNPSSHEYELYESKRAWSEGGATWQVYDTGLPWETAGASGANDRGSTALGGLSAPSTGFQTVALNASGIAVVQGWIDSPSSNLGFVLQDYSDANSDGIDFYTREAAAVGDRPMLSVTYLPAGSNIPPTASFTADPAVGNATLSVSFDASASNDPDGTIVTYAWDFGDGGFGSGPTTTHDYTAPGTYLAELAVTDDDGDSDTTATSINVTEPGTIRFAVIGDFGSAGTAEAGVASQVASWGPDFILTVGDNNYPDGAASTIDPNIGQYYSDFIYPYSGSYGSSAATNRFFPSLGNHDWHSIACTGGTCSGPYFDYFTLPASPAAERYYDFVWGDVHFFAVDSDSGEPDGTSDTSTQAQWLQAALAASTSVWNVVYFHHAAYSSSSSHGSTAGMQWPFADWGADVVMGGHDHTYERIFRDGIVYYVNGLGGRSIYSFGTPVAGSQVRYNGDYGAMRIDANATSMTIEFITRTGILIDTYTLNTSAPAPPVAAFSGTPLTGLAPLDVSFTDESTNSPTAWSWNFGDGGSSTERHPIHTYSLPGTYTVSLEATNADGSDTETKVDYVTAQASTTRFQAQSETTNQGSVNGSYTDTYADDGSFEVLTEEETNGRPDSRTSLLDHRWTFNLSAGISTLFYVSAYRDDNDDNDDFVFELSTDNVNFTPLLTVNSSTEMSYQVPVPSNPTGTVYVRAADTNRNRGARSKDRLHVDYMYFETLNSAAAPVASFSADPTSGGAPLQVQFTDLSSYGPTAWSWDFGDGGTSTAQHPSHTYTSVGDYDVSLTVTNAYGSDDEIKTGYVSVSSMPVVHVADIVVSRSGQKWLRGTADVLIEDGSGTPVAGATVSGFFSDPNPAVFSMVTGGGGISSFESDRTKTPPSNWCFEVTNVSLSGVVYDPGANVYTSRCEDGSGAGPALAFRPGDLAAPALVDNYPNPFNPATTISFVLDRPRHVRLEVFDQTGRRVAVLTDETREAGMNVVRWDAAGRATGMYFYRLTAGDFVATRSMFLLR